MLKNKHRTLSEKGTDNGKVLDLNWHYIDRSIPMLTMNHSIQMMNQTFPMTFIPTDVYHLRKSEIEKAKKIFKIENSFSDTPTIEDKYANYIDILQGEIEILKSQIFNFKPRNSNKLDEFNLYLKRDCLHIEICELNYKIESIESDYETVKRSLDTTVELLNQSHLTNPYQAEIDDIRNELMHNQNDYMQARSLLLEMKRVGWSSLPHNLSEFCEIIEHKMDNLKNRLEHEKFTIFMNRLSKLKTSKEIITVKSSLKRESLTNLLYEMKIENAKNIQDKMENNIKQLQYSIDMRHLKLDLCKIDSKYALERARFVRFGEKRDSLSLDSTLKRKDYQRKKFQINTTYNSEQFEFLQEKILELNKSINDQKLENSNSKKLFLILQEEFKKYMEIQQDINKIIIVKNKIHTNLKQEVTLRKKYFNQIEDLKGKIRVYCRCRPLSHNEINRQSKICVSFPDMYTIVVTGPKNKVGKEFQFDIVFPPQSSQKQIFTDTSLLMQSAFDGFNVCIFAYGQTGSGKTYTLIGDLENNPGIVFRMFERIFEIVNKEKINSHTHVQCYMLELYNEKLLDLLNSDAIYTDKLEIKKTSTGMTFVSGAEFQTAVNAIHLKDLFMKGSSNRHVASTKMNSESSRSHLIISIMLTCHLKNSENIVRGKISIIDLAGSERMNKSGVQGITPTGSNVYKSVIIGIRRCNFSTDYRTAIYSVQE